MTADLANLLEPAAGSKVSFAGLYPADFLDVPGKSKMAAWHLVGGLDALESRAEVDDAPDDGYPVTLREWMRTDGLTCLKIKLRGNDAAWDYDRIVHVGKIAIEEDALWLTTDFNCTVTDPAYVNDILDRLQLEHPRIYGMILYVEQPFPYELEHDRIDVHSVSARKPLFMDESAHDWRVVRLGRELGWTRRRTQDVQDSNRCLTVASLGQSTRHDADGAGSYESHARSDSACVARVARPARSWVSRQTVCSFTLMRAHPKPRFTPVSTRGEEGAWI